MVLPLTPLPVSNMPPSCQTSDFDCESPRSIDASVPGSEEPDEPCLRGLRWRVFLGVLPPCPTTIDSLRRAAANGRRRYAELRRGLIVDPRSAEDVQKGENLSINNPLSQDPDSIWGRYFRNAELETMIESDLTRLYPEHGGFFQSDSSQAMLRRILLVWALVNPQHGYRQGMHELLAPLVYVLHKDVTYLSQVRQRHQDPFEDRFDSPQENRYSLCQDKTQGKLEASSSHPQSSLHVLSKCMSIGDKNWLRLVLPDDLSSVEADDFGTNLKTMILGSDGYGAEGELGALISRRFIEHDAYCMFDSLLRGQGGAVALADFFTPVTDGGPGLSPVLEASGDIYHSLAAADVSLYIHLVGLGVEPQFFALRWLRVLFGREFVLENLLLLWDAILAASSEAEKSTKLNVEQRRKSARGSFISSFAVSMILHLRSTLLASSNATTCLQRLLNFPKTLDIRSLIENAKRLLMYSDRLLSSTPVLASKNTWTSGQSSGSIKFQGSSQFPPLQAGFFSPISGLHDRFSGIPEMNRSPLPEFYWEERWRDSVLCKESQNGVAESGDVAHVSRSISAPEEVLVNGNREAATGPECNDLVIASHSDLTEQLMMHGDLLKGPPDEEGRSNSFPAEISNIEARLRTEACCAESSRPLSTRLASDSVERETKEEHMCINALDLSLRTQTNDHASRPYGTVCLCNSCNFSQEEVLQRRRRHSIGDLPFPIDRDQTQDVPVDRSCSTMEVSKKDFQGKFSGAQLHALGQSMVQSIQVLEISLSKIFKEGGAFSSHPAVPHNTSSLDPEVHITAVMALKDLRKISKVLLQM